MGTLISLVDQQLKDWVGSLIEDANVTFAAPGIEKIDPCVGLYLMELREKKPPSTTSRTPLQLSLRYLVTAWSEKPGTAHDLLGRLVFAAMDKGEFGVELQPLAGAEWSAFGVAPRPAFLLDVPLRQDRPEPRSQLVRQPLIVNSSTLALLRGIVVGPGNRPIGGARVELPSLRLVTTTDRKGVFQFHSLPAGLAVQLRIHARGKSLSVTATEGAGSQDTPLVVEMPFPEE